MASKGGASAGQLSLAEHTHQSFFAVHSQLPLKLFASEMFGALRAARNPFPGRAFRHGPTAALIVEPGMQDELKLLETGDRYFLADQFLRLPEFVLYQEVFHFVRITRWFSMLSGVRTTTHGSRSQKRVCDCTAQHHGERWFMMTGVTHDADIPTIMFGAFDRHNFGDLLFPHIAAALTPAKETLFTGLAQRDLRPDGGHEVEALAQVAERYGDSPVNIIHVGGELLTCDTWQAAVMLLPSSQAQETIIRLVDQPQARMEWARGMLGSSSLAPYTVSPGLFPRAAVVYNGVGGVDLDDLDPAVRAEVVCKLKAADFVTVRDRRTQALLVAEGISVCLIPDPAVMVAELFGTRICERLRSGEVAQILQAFPNGYIAVQFSTDFGDDATLARIAAQLDRIAIATGYGVAFFRAGAAPWHDDMHCYERVAARMRVPSVKVFQSLNLWDICALIAGSRVYCGSSLHGRIVAMAFALPRVNLSHSSQAMRPTKQAAFAETWEEAGVPSTVVASHIADGIRYALATAPEQRRRTAGELVAHYRQGFDAVLAALKGPDP